MLLLIAGVQLLGCRSDVDALVYTADLQAVAAEQGEGSVEVTVSAFASGIANRCTETWEEFGHVFKRYFEKSTLVGCKNAGFEDELSFKAMVPLVYLTGIDKPPSSSTFAVLLKTAEDSVIVSDVRYEAVEVSVYLNFQRFQAMEAELSSTNPLVSIDKAKVRAALIVRNDRREEAFVEVFGVTVGNKPYPKQAYVSIPIRQDARIQLSDVHVRSLFLSGATHPLTLLVPKVN